MKNFSIICLLLFSLVINLKIEIFDGLSHGSGLGEGTLAVIVMDNASFHRKKRLYEIAQGHKVKIIFLPPYSQKLNPIEHFWHWLKKICDVSKFSRNFDDVFLSIFQVL